MLKAKPLEAKFLLLGIGSLLFALGEGSLPFLDCMIGGEKELSELYGP